MAWEYMLQKINANKSKKRKKKKKEILLPWKKATRKIAWRI